MDNDETEKSFEFEQDVPALLAISLSNFLQEKEGIAVHFNNHAFLIYNEDGQILINEDETLLGVDHLSLIWVHDKDDPNDQIPDDALTPPPQILN